LTAVNAIQYNVHIFNVNSKTVGWPAYSLVCCTR